MIKRLDHLDVATSDLADAASIYERNFGFKVNRSADSETASVTVGGAEIRLASGALAKAALESQGEGMTGLWLEAEDIEQVVAAFKKAGLAVGKITKEQGRRVFAVDPKIANQVPLFIFDRKS
jgi:predicted enzyme related to lactoylglutathione lyase